MASSARAAAACAWPSAPARRSTDGSHGQAGPAAPEGALRAGDPARAEGAVRVLSSIDAGRRAIEKITLNMGVGDAKQDSNMLDAAMEQLATIAGQKPSVRRARKSIAAFKLRDGHAGRRERDAAPRAHVRVPRPADVGRDPADPRLPRSQPALVRRPRQLLDGRPRADHLPGDRLRRDRPGARARRDDHHDGRDRRGGLLLCCASSACRSRARGPRARRRRRTRRPPRSSARRRRAPRAEAEQAALEQLKEENPEAYEKPAPSPRRTRRRGRSRRGDEE